MTGDTDSDESPGSTVSHNFSLCQHVGPLALTLMTGSDESYLSKMTDCAVIPLFTYYFYIIFTYSTVALVGGTTGSASDQRSEGCGFQAY